MKAVTKIEIDYPSSSAEALSPVELNVRGQKLNLRHARLGNDFVFGFGTNYLLAVPSLRVSTIRGCLPDQIEDLELLEFLGLQKAPVRLELEVDGRQISCWLLNIDGSWLRISTRTGVEWVHLSAVVIARVGPVDNPKR